MVKIMGIVDAIPPRGYPQGRKPSEDIVTIETELASLESGQILATSFEGATDSPEGDIKRASRRAMTLRTRAITARARSLIAFDPSGRPLVRVRKEVLYVTRA